MRRLPLFAALVTLMAFGLAPPLVADPYVATAPVQASGASPFAANCSLTPGVDPQSPTGEGIVFPDSEVEPWVEVHPTDPDIVAAMWQQDRWSNGGARGNALGFSFDGGTSWSLVNPPGVSDCSVPAGEFDRASDPWISFGPDGTLYVMHLVLDIETLPGREGGFGPNGMMVQKIAPAAFGDGLITTAEISDTQLIAFDDRGDLHDKNALTADPTRPGFAYAVWDFLDLPQGAIINPDRGVFGGGLGFKGAALFSKTEDFGETWTEHTVLYNPGGVNQTIGNQIVVDDDGVLFNFFDEILNFRQDDRDARFDLNLSMKFSPDAGDRWLPNGRPIRIENMRPRLVRIPAGDDNAGAPVRSGEVIPEVAADPSTGDLFAVWMDTRFSAGAHNDIAFTMSADGGRSWSPMIMVNQTPDSLGGHSGHAFTPSVHVAADGTIAVSYYDFRENVEGGGTDTTHFVVHCHPATEDCGDAASWDEETQVGDPFDIQLAPFARGFFLGDYVGLDNVANAFAPFFTMTGSTGPSDEFYATVSP